MIVYYAHCKAIYNTPQEERDIELLHKLGFRVLNPSAKDYDANWQEFGMDFANTLVKQCHALVFRALPDGSIPAGVATEIAIANDMNIPIFELPSFHLRRILDVDETRQYLRETGQR